MEKNREKETSLRPHHTLNDVCHKRASRACEKKFSTLEENICIHVSNIIKHPLHTWMCVTHFAWKPSLVLTIAHLQTVQGYEVSL